MTDGQTFGVIFMGLIIWTVIVSMVFWRMGYLKGRLEEFENRA